MQLGLLHSADIRSKTQTRRIQRHKLKKKNLKNETKEKVFNLYKYKYYIETTIDNTAVESENKDDFIYFDCIYVVNQKQSESWKREINAYFEVPRVYKDVNILEWWKVHVEIYSNFAYMARDILNTLALSVP